MKEGFKKYSDIIKWIIILVILVIVYFWKQKDINSALEEIKGLPVYISALLWVLGLMYFVMEGGVIALLTRHEEHTLSWIRGVQCSFYCAFYKLITLAMGSGAAEVYFLSSRGTMAGRAAGLCMLQYSLHKVAVTVYGVLSFVVLYAMGVGSVLEYKWWIMLGAAASLLIAAGIMVLAVSCRINSLLVRLVHLVMDKHFAAAAEKLDYQLVRLREMGRDVISHPGECVLIVLLHLVKMLFWYMIPGAVLSYTSSGSIVLCMALMAVANMLGAVMVSPAGMGTLEFVVTLLFGDMFGNSAVTVAILYRFMTMIAPFIVGTVVVATYKGGKNVRD